VRPAYDQQSYEADSCAASRARAIAVRVRRSGDGHGPGKIRFDRCAHTKVVRKIPVKVKLFHQSTCRGKKVYDLYELQGAQIRDDGDDVLSFEIDCSRPPLTAGQRRADP
jgi:hypothetical protein